MTSIPSEHNGMWYNELLSKLSAKRNTKRYLEIGVRNGSLLKEISAEVAVGVDPAFEINGNVSHGKKITTLIQSTSDEFFASEILRNTLAGPPDLAFIDGLHVFEFLLRDFYNTEKICAKSSLICMHDCLPLDGQMINRSSRFIARGGKFDHWWTGDVWKVVFILKEYRPDLRLVCVDCKPTGLVFVTNLNPESTVLSDKYFEIIDKYKSIKNDINQIEELYNSVKVVKAEDVINEFDHSLYFVV